MARTKGNWISRMLVFLARLGLDHPILVLGAATALTVFALWRSFHLGLDTDLKALLPEDYPSITRLQDLKTRMGAQNDLMVEVRSPDFEANKKMGAVVADFLKKREDIRYVIFHREKAVIERSALLFLSLHDLTELRERVIERIRREVRKELAVDEGDDGAAAPDDEDEDDPFERKKAAAEKDDEADDDPFEKKSAAANKADPAAGGSAAKPYSDEDLSLDEEEIRKRYAQYDIAEYQMADEGRILVVTARPTFPTTEVKSGTKLVRDVTKAIEEMNPAQYHPEMQVRLQGFYADMTGEVDALKSEVFSSSAVSFLLLGLIVVVYFRAFRPVLLIFVPLTMSAIWCLGTAELLYGSLNLVSAFIFGILLGFGIDFGIHIVARQREEIWGGRGGREAFLEATATTGVSVFTGGTTTAVVFFMLHLANFKGFSQFGIAAGSGVMYSLIAMYTVLPACVALFEKVWPWRPKRLVHVGHGSLADRLRVRPAFVWVGMLGILAISLGFTVYSAVHLTDIGYEYDFSKLGMRKKPTTANAGPDYREAVGGAATKAPAIVLAEHPADAEFVHRELTHLREAVVAHGAVARAPDPTFLPDDRLRALAALWSLENTRILGTYLYKIFSLYSFVPENQAEKLPILADIRRRLEQKRGLFEGKDRDDLDNFLEHVATEPLTKEVLPAWIRDQFRELDGSEGELVLVYTLGSKDNYDVAKALKTALFDIKLTDGRTAPSAANYFVLADVIDTIKRDAPPILGASVLLILVLVALHLRRVRSVVMVLVPLTMVTLWSCGYLVLSDTKLNFYNMVLIPLIIGMAVDAGVHMFARYEESGRGSLPRTVLETGGAVFIAQLTTVVGFGGMFTSNHVGLASMGMFCIVGTALCFVGSVVTLPAILWLLEKTGRAAAGAPVGSDPLAAAVAAEALVKESNPHA